MGNMAAKTTLLGLTYDWKPGDPDNSYRRQIFDDSGFDKWHQKEYWIGILWSGPGPIRLRAMFGPSKSLPKLSGLLLDVPGADPNGTFEVYPSGENPGFFVRVMLDRMMISGPDEVWRICAKSGTEYFEFEPGDYELRLTVTSDKAEPVGAIIYLRADVLGRAFFGLGSRPVLPGDRDPREATS